MLLIDSTPFLTEADIIVSCCLAVCATLLALGISACMTWRLVWCMQDSLHHALHCATLLHIQDDEIRASLQSTKEQLQRDIKFNAWHAYTLSTQLSTLRTDLLSRELSTCLSSPASSSTASSRSIPNTTAPLCTDSTRP